jgi:hypothetical protein
MHAPLSTRAAAWSAVSPIMSTASASAPAPRSQATTAAWPPPAAAMRGVVPSASEAPTTAPCCSRARAVERVLQPLPYTCTARARDHDAHLRPEPLRDSQLPSCGGGVQQTSPPRIQFPGRPAHPHHGSQRSHVARPRRSHRIAHVGRRGARDFEITAVVHRHGRQTDRRRGRWRREGLRRAPTKLSTRRRKHVDGAPRQDALRLSTTTAATTTTAECGPPDLDRRGRLQDTRGMCTHTTTNPCHNTKHSGGTAALHARTWDQGPQPTSLHARTLAVVETRAPA